MTVKKTHFRAGKQKQGLHIQGEKQQQKSRAKQNLGVIHGPRRQELHPTRAMALTVSYVVTSQV